MKTHLVCANIREIFFSGYAQRAGSMDAGKNEFCVEEYCVLFPIVNSEVFLVADGDTNFTDWDGLFGWGNWKFVI